MYVRVLPSPCNERGPKIFVSFAVPDERLRDISVKTP